MIEIGQWLGLHETPKRLNIPTVGTVIASGSLLFALGFVFFAVGSFISMLGLEWIPIEKSKVHMPMGILVLAGLVFALPGGMLIFSGIKRTLNKRRMRELQSRHQAQAWAWDGNWDGRILTDRNAAYLWTSLFGIGFLACFAGVFHYVGFVDKKAPDIFRYAAIFIDAGLALAAIFFVRNLLRLTKHGRGRIELEDMPIRPGHPCRLQLTLGSDISLFDDLHLDLAFVEERVIETGSGRNRSRQLIAETRLQEILDIQLAENMGSMQKSLTFTIALPEGSPATQISSHPSKSWQLGIHLETIGLDYKGRFVLPVYQVGKATSSEPVSTQEVTELLTVS